MAEMQWLHEQFEAHRPQLRAIAYRMLGSTADAEDAIQDAWLRVCRAESDDVENIAAWLTTVVARVCLSTLRARRQRREHAFVRVPDPIISYELDPDPEQQAMLADGVGLAMLIVLDSLTPTERISFVLHDMFAVPFDVIATMIDRTPEATRKAASRARRRVRQETPPPEPDLARLREVVDAFFAASRDGNFEALVSVLHPDVVLRSDGGTKRAHLVLHGREQVARQAFASGRLSPFVQRVLINGTAGVVVSPHGKPQFVMAFTVTDGLITAIDVLADPDRLAAISTPPSSSDG